MAKKFIDIMDTSFRDGFQSVYGGRVLMNDFFPAVEAAKTVSTEKPFAHCSKAPVDFGSVTPQSKVSCSPIGCQLMILNS